MRKLYRNYILQTLLIVMLFLTFIYLEGFFKIFLAIFLGLYAILICYLIKKNKVISIKNKQVTLLMAGMAIIGLTIYYLLGLHFGYAKSDVRFSLWSIGHFILPISIIIISSEIIRFRFSMEQTKISEFLNIVAMILADMIVYAQLYDITAISDFFEVTGFILFASISCNLLYEYISPKYGCIPIIAYRLIMGLYSYIIPVVPKVYIFTASVLRMIYPFIVYLILEFVFSKKIKGTELKRTRRSYVIITIMIVISILLTMLISCKFYYGIIVIGSESMTGSINKGDAAIFIQYKGQEIKKGDILIFTKNNRQIIHRVVDITRVGNNYRYYTKGDANPNMDSDYVEEDEIIGICKLKIKYMGYPTLLIKNTFDKN